MKAVVVLAAVAGCGAAAAGPTLVPPASPSVAVAPRAAEPTVWELAPWGPGTSSERAAAAATTGTAPERSGGVDDVAPPATSRASSAVPPVPDRGREALHFRTGAHLVEVDQEVKPPGMGTVVELRVDGAVLFPPACAFADRRGLCSVAHRRVRDAHGEYAMLVDHIAGGDRVELFVAAVFPGSPECGAYGYWSIFVGPRGVRISEPIEGCFPGAQPRTDETPPSPQVTWGAPTMVTLVHPLRGRLLYELDRASYRWRVVREIGDW